MEGKHVEILGIFHRTSVLEELMKTCGYNFSFRRCRLNDCTSPISIVIYMTTSRAYTTRHTAAAAAAISLKIKGHNAALILTAARTPRTYMHIIYRTAIR